MGKWRKRAKWRKGMAVTASLAMLMSQIPVSSAFAEEQVHAVQTDQMTVKQVPQETTNDANAAESDTKEQKQTDLTAPAPETGEISVNDGQSEEESIQKDEQPSAEESRIAPEAKEDEANSVETNSEINADTADSVETNSELNEEPVAPADPVLEATVPHLLITEISPNTKGGGTDYFEYFELYNNSDQPITTTNYQFIYHYTDTGKELPFQIPAAIIQPQETMIFWFNNGGNTLADFNAHFGTELSENQVVEFTDVFPGFANGGNRALVLKDRQGAEVISAS